MAFMAETQHRHEEELRQLSGVNEALIGALARGEPFGQVAEEHRNPAIDATIARDSKYLQTVEKRNADATVRCYENALRPFTLSMLDEAVLASKEGRPWGPFATATAIPPVYIHVDPAVEGGDSTKLHAFKQNADGSLEIVEPPTGVGPIVVEDRTDEDLAKVRPFVTSLAETALRHARSPAERERIRENLGAALRKDRIVVDDVVTKTEGEIGIEVATAYAKNVEETKRERRELAHIRKSEVQKTRELHPLEEKEAATIREINERNASYYSDFQNRWNEYDKNAVAVATSNLIFGKDAENVFVRAPFDFKNHKPDECQVAGYCEVCAKQIPADSPRAIEMRKAVEAYGVAYIESHDLIPDAPLGILSAHERGEHQPALIDVRVGMLDLGIEKVSHPRVIFPQSLIATQFVAFRCGCTAVLLSDLGEKWGVATSCPCSLHAMKPSPFRGFDFGIKRAGSWYSHGNQARCVIDFHCGCSQVWQCVVIISAGDLLHFDASIDQRLTKCSEHRP